MPSALKRGPITTRLILELEGSGYPVGDNASPTVPYGWQGEPNQVDATFIPYMGLTPLTGIPQRSGQGGSLGDSGTEWTLPYTVLFAGITRKQTEALSDRVRGQLTNISREGVGIEEERWRIQQIRCISVGSNTRIGSAYPDYYTQADTFEVWVSKER